MKGTIFTILTICMLTSIATGQVIICDSIVFEAGKSQISESSTKTVLNIPEMVRTMEFFDISLTAYSEKPDIKQVKQSLAMKRIREICNYLIRQNLGSHITDIDIVYDDGAWEKAIGKGNHRNRVDIAIREQLPVPHKDELNEDEIAAAPAEPDTIITTSKGIQIIIMGGTFDPFKSSDYFFDIKELNTTDDFVNHNVSTTTWDRQIIQAAYAIRVMAIPKNPSAPALIKIKKPIIVMIPVEDSLTSKTLSLLYQAKNNKPFTTWKETNSAPVFRKYGDNMFYKIQVNQLGWFMVGEILTSCNCCRITFPQFQIQKMNLVYPDKGSVIFFENIRENVINLPCAEGDRGLITSIIAYDKSGQMFSLDRTFSTPETKKGDIGIYKIRKKDYVKL